MVRAFVHTSIFKHKLPENMLGILRFLGLAPAAAPPARDLSVDVYLVNNPEPAEPALERPAKRARVSGGTRGAAHVCAACARPMLLETCPRGCFAPDGLLYCAPECIPAAILVQTVNSCLDKNSTLRRLLSEAERELAEARQQLAEARQQLAQQREDPLQALQREFPDLGPAPAKTVRMLEINMDRA